IGGDAAWALRDRRGPTKSCAAAFTSNGSRPNETTEANSTLEPNETVPFRKKLYDSLEMLQKDLDEWLDN
ncbi:MAG: hypothetical protein CL597_00270, partial [Alteromonas sp.]|nr:hypothetical protein [Alteromonas sp.]